MKLAIEAMVMLRVTDQLLTAYERATPVIDQELVNRVLGAMERLRKASNLLLEFHGERQAV